jgi:hypothetical protein
MIALMKFPERAVRGGDPINALVERVAEVDEQEESRQKTSRSPHRKDAQKQKRVPFEKEINCFSFFDLE